MCKKTPFKNKFERQSSSQSVTHATHRLDRVNIRICILNGQAVAGIRVITGPEFLSKFTIEFL